MDYLGGLIFAFLTIVVLIVIIFTTKTPKKTSSFIPSPEKTYPKGFNHLKKTYPKGVNHLKKTNSPRYEHATLGMGKGKKVVLVIIIIVGGFFGIGVGAVLIFQQVDPEGYAQWSAEMDAEQAADEARERQKKLAEQAQKEKATQIKTSTALPSSCRGVNSMELDLYPTGKECFAALNKRVEEWCLSQRDCVTQFYLKLANQCEDPVLSSVEVCLMYTLKELYPKLIP